MKTTKLFINSTQQCIVTSIINQINFSTLNTRIRDETLYKNSNLEISGLSSRIPTIKK